MADTLDLITLAEAKRALNLDTSNTTHDTELESYITAVSRRLDDLCGPVVIRTITGEVHSGGAATIWLHRAPMSASSTTTVTTVTEYAGTTGTVLTAETNLAPGASAYLFDRSTGALRRRSGGNDAVYPAGRFNVVVTYQAGRYADTAAVDAKFKQACAISVAHLFRSEQGFSAIDDGVGYRPSFSLPKRALELIASEMSTRPLVA
jgi:hypothetical protein